jgi:excisionase family DNA binding protein
MSDLEPLLTPEDVATLAGVNYHSVLRDIRSGKLSATRKGKGYRIERAWYLEWLAADLVTPAARGASPPRRRRVPGPAGSLERLRAIERKADAA